MCSVFVLNGCHDLLLTYKTCKYLLEAFHDLAYKIQYTRCNIVTLCAYIKAFVYKATFCFVLP